MYDITMVYCGFWEYGTMDIGIGRTFELYVITEFFWWWWGGGRNHVLLPSCYNAFGPHFNHIYSSSSSSRYYGCEQYLS